jgi:hypothetical protein
MKMVICSFQKRDQWLFGYHVFSIAAILLLYFSGQFKNGPCSPSIGLFSTSYRVHYSNIITDKYCANYQVKIG